ncbi:MAG: alpha-D-ribose 1-methylphosphonate 5-triphosphate diphosphatase [Burkholderiaceae bacterium]
MKSEAFAVEPATPGHPTPDCAVPLIIKNARLVLADEVIHGCLKIVGGRITAIDSGSTRDPGAIDANGDTLVAGLVELHTDNLERHMMPRPKTSFPAQPALLAHDAEVVSAGITTVFDALGVGDPYSGGFRDNSQQEILRLLDSLAAHGVLRAEHLIHVRCELPAPNARALFEPFIANSRLKMISLMDHTPGQRQWTDIEHARTYYTGKKGWSEQRFDEEITLAPARQAEHAKPNREYFRRYAIDAGLALATHDDTTEEQVIQAHTEGASISEFPTTLVAARKAKELSLVTIAGAPNIVRGGSHSGNVAAADLARHGLLDILSSDYVPTSLINAAWKLTQCAGLALPKAIATVTSNPARAAGLTDRGQIKIGLRADLVRVREIGDMPAIADVWVEGRRVH